MMNFGATKFEIKKYVLSQIDEPVHSRSFASLLSFFASFALFRG
jgi:hypothetical protein